MTKKEIIEKYGEEEYQRRLEQIKQHQQQYKEEYRQYHQQYYQQHRDEINQHQKQYDQEHKEERKKYYQQYREQHREEYKQWARKKRYMFAYCIPEQIEQIENYELAKKDNFQGWNIHHRLETHNSDGQRRLADLSKAELIALDMYYNRPANELVFLTNSEHTILHNKKVR